LRGSNFSRGNEYPEDFRGFTRSFQANSGTVLRLDHDRFLPNPFQFIIHLPFHSSALYSLVTKSIVKQLTGRPIFCRVLIPCFLNTKIKKYTFTLYALATVK
jgi:hypothetical protein